MNTSSLTESLPNIVNTNTVELKSAEDWARAFPILSQFRPKLTLERLLQSREKLQLQGYELLGLEVKGELVAVAGIQLIPHLLRCCDLRVNDLATLEASRSQGFGKALVKHIEELAKQRNCSRILLYSQLPNVKAHQFYRRQGFRDYGIEFVKEF